MIHTLEVDSTTTIEELRKIARKRLMTGGVVIRLKPDLVDEDLVLIAERFLPYVDGYNLATEVVLRLAEVGVFMPRLQQVLAPLELASLDSVERLQRLRSFAEERGVQLTDS